MEKSSNFFLIHNYNMIPEELLAYCRDYLIIDASDDGKTTEELKKRGLHYQHCENTGHNITSYFSWFAERYEELPEVVCLCKGNMLARHCSAEYFSRVYRNTWFTFLYEEKSMRPRYGKATPEILAANQGKDPGKDSIAGLLSESWYQELNSSWYMRTGTHPHRYFKQLDDLLKFIYKDPVIPRNVCFSPGACYILRRDQIQLHGPAFYRNLNRIMNYTLDPGFPAEAFIVERLLPMIFTMQYEVNPWMENEEMFGELLAQKERELLEERKREQEEGKKRFRRLHSLLKRV